ncbi:VWA domain-containing protein [Candidatus Woesearchaeota archaeon]|nr:VWA domain-containing protein [Candidatus Woesearchaeota archaeon]
MAGKKYISKKAFFFSIDALIAVILTLSILMIVPSFYMREDQPVQPVFFSSDIVQLLSTMKVGEMNSPGIVALIDSSNISDLNRTILEQALRFQVSGYEEKANKLLNLSIGNLLPGYYNIGIWIEGYDDPVYASGDDPVTELISSKQMVSGIEMGRAIEGLSARAFLTGMGEKVSSTYVYFGGYEGDGNITKRFELPSDKSIISAYMELDINNDFEFYINSIPLGTFYPVNLNETADSWDIANISYFHEGNNTIEFRFGNSAKGYIGGGYFKIVYISSEIVSAHNETRHHFPGIKGIINLYDSFYVPGMLKSMSAHLHYDNDYNIFFNIGNETVYRDMNCNGEYVIDLGDSNFSSLDYASLSGKTIPIRLGTDAFELMKEAFNADVILITDLSGSMNWQLDSDDYGTIRGCEDPQLYDSNTRRISLAKCLDKEFINLIMNATGNRMGLVGFSSSAHTYTPDLAYTREQLISHVNDYSNSPSGSTCICCAINRAYNLLSASLYSMAILVPRNSIWTYNTLYPLSAPPEDESGNNWTGISYNDSSWNSSHSILGFEKSAYSPYVDSAISINSIVSGNTSYNSSDYFLINYSVAGGGLSDTYLMDSSSFEITYRPDAGVTEILYDGFEDYYGDGAHQIDGNDINVEPGYWYVDDTGEEVFIMANNAGYYAYSGTDVLVFRDMDSYGYAETTIDLSSYSSPVLSYWWRLGPNSFDFFEYANVRVWDGAWHTLATYNSFDSGHVYQYAEFDLSSYNKVSNFIIRFGARSSWDDERFYVDEVDVKEAPSLQPPEIWVNSTAVSYSDPFNGVSSMIKFMSNISANYSMKIYNFNRGEWESDGCDSAEVAAGAWNSFSCSKADPLDYISEEDNMMIGLAAGEAKASNVSIDFVQHYTTMINGSYYFRKHFTVDDKEVFHGIDLYVLSDDRAEVYLNSHLIDNEETSHNAEYWNRYSRINLSYLRTGENVLAVKLYNNDSRSAKFDLQLEVNSSRQRYIIVMSDGITGYHCGGCGAGCSGSCTATSGSYDCSGLSSDCYGTQCDTAINDAICSSCRAHTELNTTVYSIGFGPVDECHNANRTLQGIADCGNGSYYASSDASELKDIYSKIAENILSATYQAQFINVSGIGGISPSTLYPDSYIELKYTPSSGLPTYGLIPITIESGRFGNTLTEGSFYVPENVVVYDAKLTSYSGDLWSSQASIKDAGEEWVTFYNLSEFSDDYLNLGDPYMINIPADLILKGRNNTVLVRTAADSLNSSGGSPDDRAIYTIGVGIDINYTGVFERAEGCVWDVEFEDGTDSEIPVPSSYAGADECTFDETTDCDDYYDDAVDNVICRLFQQLDFDDDGRLFVKFGPGDLDIEIYSIGRIPFMWGPIKAEVRVWK